MSDLVMGPEPTFGSDIPGLHIWGWMSSAELLWLNARAGEMGSVAEIGCLRGRSSFALLSGCPGPVYCVDPWHDPGEHALTGFMESCGHFPNLRPVRSWSPAAAAEVPDVDMCFVDGSHDYDSVMADLAAWTPKTRRLICGHDYSDGRTMLTTEGEHVTGYPGVKQAVDEVFGDRVELPDLTSIWAVWLYASGPRAR